MRIALALALALVACANAESPTDEAEVFEFEPGLFVSLKADSKADLPNSQFYPRGLDTSGYRTIADLFVRAMYDVTRTDAPVAFDWPLSGSRAVLNRSGTPILLSSSVYEHTGFDIIRVTEMEDPTLRAPVGGKATITDWSGNASSSSYDYSTVISIWDPDTHLIVQLMHVKPDPMLPRSGFFDITRGQVIGELAEVPSVPGNARHTHVSIVDAQIFEILDPVGLMPEYPDMTKPVAGELYLLDETAARHDVLKTGALDVIVTGHDRDEMSGRNLEVTSLAYAVEDQDGNELTKLERCHMRDAFKKLVGDWNTTTSTIRLIDFGNASGQFSGFWPGSDLGNPDRLFRYALTNLRVDTAMDGTKTCVTVAADRDGQLTIADTVTSVTIIVDMWDARDNRETKQYTLTRQAPPPPQP
ncbi:MAG TPA: hypothetical protein VIV11_39035 [Kofleriaceae bacterium]